MHKLNATGIIFEARLRGPAVDLNLIDSLAEAYGLRANYCSLATMAKASELFAVDKCLLFVLMQL